MVKLKIFLGERGFVLIEFVIALPLLMLLLYAIGTMSVRLMEIAQRQAADYVLESEINNVLGRITDDARAAVKIEINSTGNDNLDEITFLYHSTSSDLFGNKKTVWALGDLLETRRYTVYKPKDRSNFYIYSRRADNDKNSTTITGGNFFGDTTVTEFKFSNPSENVLHIAFEVQNVKTKKSLRVCTSVYMPSCKEFIQ